MGYHICSIYQDRNNNYWFGSDDYGVYRYDGNSLVLFADKDGLRKSQVRTIQEDEKGTIWFRTNNSIYRYRANPENEKNQDEIFEKVTLPTSPGAEAAWTTSPGDLWFGAIHWSKNLPGVFRYDGKKFTYLRLPEAPVDSSYLPVKGTGYNPYTVYCVYKDRKGRVWFGTQQLGVCCFDPATGVASGKSFTWFNEGGLANSVVRSIYEDKNGNLWFGTLTALFRYDGKKVSNFSEEMGLFDRMSNSLTGIWTITEDNSGNIWIGTRQSGAWRYNGKEIYNFSVKDGLPSNFIHTIYKDNQGTLWFGTARGVCKFDGKTFLKFEVKA